MGGRRGGVPYDSRSAFVEIDWEFVKVGKMHLEAKPIEWKNDLSNVKPHDMALFSYSWGEINNPTVLHQAWELCHKFLVVVEPGTPRGYAAPCYRHAMSSSKKLDTLSPLAPIVINVSSRAAASGTTLGFGWSGHESTSGPKRGR
jgi:hypothetical protein